MAPFGRSSRRSQTSNPDRRRLIAAQPQQQAQDTLRQSHQVAQQGLGMAANVLQKAHDSAMTQQQPDDKHAQLLQAIQSIGQGGDAGGQGQGGYPSDPGSQQSAVWGAFPGTDPNAVDHLVQTSGGDPSGILGPLFHLFQGDEEKLASMHQMILDHILSMLSAPQGGPAAQASMPSPEVGGDHLGIG